MSFFNNKRIEQRLCNTEDSKKELMHTFGKFSKYFQNDCYYSELETKMTTPVLSKKVGCYNGSNPKKEVITSSENLQNKTARELLDKPHSSVCYRQHNSSDRANESNTTLHIPTRGNSVKRTVTSSKPGAQSAPGTGSDVKFNSYNRHQMRIKGQGLNEECAPNPVIVGIAVEIVS